LNPTVDDSVITQNPGKPSMQAVNECHGDVTTDLFQSQPHTAELSEFEASIHPINYCWF
jgi:hypothetical protein